MIYLHASLLFREHKHSMMKLRKLLADSKKIARHRRFLLNIQITFFSWIIEAVAFIMLFITCALINHENITQRLILDQVFRSLYIIVLPSIILMNESNIKGEIANSTWYITLLGFFNWNYKSPLERDDDKKEDNNPNEENHRNKDGNNSIEGNIINHSNVNKPKELGYEDVKTEEIENLNTNKKTATTVVNSIPNKSSIDNVFRPAFKSRLQSNDCTVIDLELSGE